MTQTNIEDRVFKTSNHGGIIMNSKQINMLVAENQNLVRSIARKWKRSGIEMDDLMQEGNMALIYVAKFKYDKNGPAKFSTRAFPYVQKYIREYVMGQKTVHVPFNCQYASWKLAKNEKILRNKKGSASNKDLAQKMHISSEKVNEAKRNMSQYTCEIDESHITTGNEDIFDSVYEKEKLEIIAKYSGNHLSENQQKVVEMMMEGKNLVDISKKMKVSKERCSQLFKKSVSKLQQAIGVC